MSASLRPSEAVHVTVHVAVYVDGLRPGDVHRLRRGSGERLRRGRDEGDVRLACSA